MDKTVNVETWFVWYLLSTPKERTELVKRMKAVVPLLAEPIPPVPALSSQTASLLAVHGIRRLASRMPDDLTLEDNWYVDELGSIVPFSVRQPTSIRKVVRITSWWWQAAWTIWLRAFGHSGGSADHSDQGDDVSSELRDADAMVRLVFNLPMPKASTWYSDCATLNRKTPSPRYEELRALVQYKTWDLPLRVTATRRLPAGTIEDAVAYWSGPGAIGYDDGSLIKELFRRRI